jgi:hypothetical protein
MYAIVIDVKVDLTRDDEARSMVSEMIVPRAKTHPGFARGYWLRALQGDVLRTVQLYDSEDDARATASEVASEGPPPGAPVALVSVDTYEVIASA